MTTTNSEPLVAAWVDLQAQYRLFRPPVTEEDYLALIAVLDDLTSRYDCNREPHASLFDLLAGYAHRWERTNEPDLKGSSDR